MIICLLGTKGSLEEIAAVCLGLECMILADCKIINFVCCIFTYRKSEDALSVMMMCCAVTSITMSQLYQEKMCFGDPL
jgi:hypothetical protein